MSDIAFSEISFAVRLFLIRWIVFAPHFATSNVCGTCLAPDLGDHHGSVVSEREGVLSNILAPEGRGEFISTANASVIPLHVAIAAMIRILGRTEDSGYRHKEEV